MTADPIAAAPAVGDRVTYSDELVLPPDPVGIVVEPTAEELDRIRAHPDGGHGPEFGDVLVGWPDGRAWEHPTGVRVLAPTARWWMRWSR